MTKELLQYRLRKVCPFCSSTGVAKMKCTKDYYCQHCRKHFTAPVIKSVKDRTQRPKFIKGVI